MPQIHRVLLSVTDKTGLADFARGLVAQGAQLISTGGTARLLRESGIPVTDVSEVTRFPEMMDGRVKTMHPHIAAGILAMREKPDHMRALAEHGIAPIDMVVVNLYRFEDVAAKAGATLEELIENIDIGGPTMIRSAAKNYQDVAVVASPADYARHPRGTRNRAARCLTEPTGASRARHSPPPPLTTPPSARASIGKFLSTRRPRRYRTSFTSARPRRWTCATAKIRTSRRRSMRAPGAALPAASNFTARSFRTTTWSISTRHGSWRANSKPRRRHYQAHKPGRMRRAIDSAEAYRKALACDPVSAYGGVIGINREVDAETAARNRPSVRGGHRRTGIFGGRRWPFSPPRRICASCASPRKGASGIDALVVKSISGGFLAQTADNATLDRASTVVKTKRAPTEDEWDALEFGWKVAKHVKSNAIVYARRGQTLAVGAGQMSRVDSVKFGAMKAVLPLRGSVVASDAFFPFADGVEEAARHGATAFIQPGGSVRDQDVIDAADRLGAAMVFTGIRHFRH